MKKFYTLAIIIAACASMAVAQTSTHKELVVRDKNERIISSTPLSQISYVHVSDVENIDEIDFGKDAATSATNPVKTSDITIVNCLDALDDVLYDLEHDWGATGTMLEVMGLLAKSEMYTSTAAFGTFSFTYESIAANGEPITLSAQMSFPCDTTLSDEQNRPTNVVLYNHFTITQNAQAPSNMTNLFSFQNSLASMWANSRRLSLVILPDYEGYGVSADRPHPFVQQSVLARQGLDAMRAGLELYKQMGLPELADDWQSLTYGASQGGGQAVAVHRLIEECGLSEQLRFKGSISSGGPYDPLEVLRALMVRENSSYPALYPLTIIGLCENSPYLTDVNAEQFFTPEMLDMGIMDIINGKQYNTTHLWNMMLEYDQTHDNALGYDSTTRVFKTAKIIRPEIIAVFNGENNDPELVELVDRLERAICASNNRLGIGWTPQAPTILLHSSQDTYVAYPNFLATEREWVGNNKAHFIHYDGEMLKHHNSLTGISLMGLSRVEADALLKGYVDYLPFDMHIAEPTELLQSLSGAQQKQAAAAQQ